MGSTALKQAKFYLDKNSDRNNTVVTYIVNRQKKKKKKKKIVDI